MVASGPRVKDPCRVTRWCTSTYHSRCLSAQYCLTSSARSMLSTTLFWLRPDPGHDHGGVCFQVAQSHDNRWDAARHGAAGAAGLPAGSATDSRKGWKRAQLPDWRPGGDWKKKPDAKRQKKVSDCVAPCEAWVGRHAV